MGRACKIVGAFVVAVLAAWGSLAQIEPETFQTRGAIGKALLNPSYTWVLLPIVVVVILIWLLYLDRRIDRAVPDMLTAQDIAKEEIKQQLVDELRRDLQDQAAQNRLALSSGLSRPPTVAEETTRIALAQAQLDRAKQENDPLRLPIYQPKRDKLRSLP